MAVTLAQMSRDISRQRASTVPSDMRPYNPSEIVPMPMPEQYHIRSSTNSPRQCGHSNTSVPQSYQYPYSQPTLSYPFSLSQQASPYYQSSVEHKELPPPIPPKHPLLTSFQHPSSPQKSEYSSDSKSTALFSAPSLEPDPLPPHSNPQALTQSQSQAFAASQPRPAVRLDKDEVWSSVTGLAEFRIVREAGRMPSLLSTKPLLTVLKTSTGLSIGQIRFHTITSNQIELTVNGRDTAISHSGFWHNRWSFESTTCPNNNETLYWKRDRVAGGAMLGDSKWNGNVLARLKGDVLGFDKPRLSEEAYDEIVISAIAMAEAARRQKRKSDIADLASAIGDFSNSDGGSGGASSSSG